VSGLFATPDQRFATCQQLAGMDVGGSAQYLPHNLALTGQPDPLFADDGMVRMHQAISDVPRPLDYASTALLIAAVSAGKAIVDDECAQMAAADLTHG